jgi:hypothetical protein
MALRADISIDNLGFRFRMAHGTITLVLLLQCGEHMALGVHAEGLIDKGPGYNTLGRHKNNRHT